MEGLGLKRNGNQSTSVHLDIKSKIITANSGIV